MSVLIDTTLGSFVVDLYTSSAPVASRNFLKLCKMKYYHGCLFFNVQSGYVAQTGDPTGTGRGGASIFEALHGAAAAAGFENEFRPHLRHTRRGTLSMVSNSVGGNGSQFLITLRDACPALDDRHTIFGSVLLEEKNGHAQLPDAIASLSATLVDFEGRPFVDARITRTHVLLDPFEDPRGLELELPPRSPTHARPPAETVQPRLGADEVEGIAAAAAATAAGYIPSAVEAAARRESRAAKEAASSAVLLEMTGDLPSADARPPESALFVCKLNPVTVASDLDLIFSRFGDITQCDIVKDVKTGASLCYGFVVFALRAAAEAAYLKMDNVLIDDRRIRVDFSQSVAGSRAWGAFKRGLGGKGVGAGRSGGAGVAAGSGSAAGARRSAPTSAAAGSDLLTNIFAQIHARTGAAPPTAAFAPPPPRPGPGPAPPVPSSSSDADARREGDGERVRERERHKDHRDRDSERHLDRKRERELERDDGGMAHQYERERGRDEEETRQRRHRHHHDHERDGDRDCDRDRDSGDRERGGHRRTDRDGGDRSRNRDRSHSRSREGREEDRSDHHRHRPRHHHHHESKSR